MPAALATCDAVVVAGTLPRVQTVFRDEDGNLVDPDSITVRTLDPSGDILSYDTPNALIVNVSVGVWVFTFPAPLTEVGRWLVETAATAGIVVPDTVSIAVKAGAF